MLLESLKLFIMIHLNWFLIIGIGWLAFLPVSQAQYQQQTILSGEQGQALLQQLKQDYKPAVVLDYDDARDTLYAVIYNQRDSVTCVYTGHQLPLPSGIDPSTALFKGGSGNGINTEHSYPQSKGAGQGNARSDMHHLFPVRSAVNSGRSNYPYKNIPNPSTTNWYYKTLNESYPSADPFLYSKLDTNTRRFQPRKDHCGNTARAIFYFYTMYKMEADAADPSFFAQQLPSLCQWHLDDPVDAAEWARTHQIATYQGGKVNPFVLDCSLPYRTYCPQLPANSCFTNVSKLADMGIQVGANYPNPAHLQTIIPYQLEQSTEVQLLLYNAFGQLLEQRDLGWQEAGEHSEQLALAHLAAGSYAYRLVFKTGEQSVSTLRMFVVSK